jgi:hypothetical protein
VATAQQNAITQGRMADAAMVSAQANKSRAAALNAAGGSEDKRTAALVKVQNALSADPDYKEAAKFAKYQGSIGDNARATMERRKREIYRLLAPELLESLDAGKAKTPAGSGSGAPLPPISSFYNK